MDPSFKDSSFTLPDSETQMTGDFNALECNVCSNVFSDDYCPRILACSHTFCGRCIDGIIATKRKDCPICRTKFTATAATQLTINRGLLDAAKQLSSMHVGSKTPPRESKGSLQEQINHFRTGMTKKAISDIQAVEEQVVGVIKSSDVIKDNIQQCKKEMEAFMNHLQELLDNVDENTDRWRSDLAVIQQGKEKINDLDFKLEASNDFASAGIIMDEAKKVLKSVQENLKEQKNHLQMDKADKDSTKKVVLDGRLKVFNATEEIIKRLEEGSQGTIKVDDLKSLLDLLGWNPQRELMAVQMFRGKQRVATLKIESNNQVYLSHLKEGNLPPKCFVVEVESLMKKSTQRAFLDLGIGGTVLGRITIRVTDEGNKTLNFLHMCAGDLGPSYANSWISYVLGRDKSSEYMFMGEYQVEGGTSSAAVLSGVEWEKEILEETSGKVGEVVGPFTFEYASDLCIIVSKDEPRRNGYFGMVEEGLDVVRDAILQCAEFQRLQVIDCGLIFSF